MSRNEGPAHTCPRYRVLPFLGPWQTDFPQHDGGFAAPAPLPVRSPTCQGVRTSAMAVELCLPECHVTLPLSAVLSETEAFQGLSLFLTSWG